MTNDKPVTTIKSIFLLAGEPSGDILGARLMSALKKMDKSLILSGVGGERMRMEGLSSLFNIQEIAIMGLVEIIPKLLRLRQLVEMVVTTIIQQRPDVVVTIDSPGFNLRVVKMVRERLAQAGETYRPKFIHYVAPTVWAWRKTRAAVFAKLFDKLLVLLPFEPPWFHHYDLETHFVGHPVIEDDLPDPTEAESMQESLGLVNGKKLLLIMPGSREVELLRHTDIFLKAWALFLQNQGDKFYALIPTFPHFRHYLEGRIEQVLGHLPLHQKPQVFDHYINKQMAMMMADLGMAASGTASLELALAQTPHIIGYRVNGLSYFLLRRLVNTRFINLVNILLHRHIVPEFIQEQCTSQNLANELISLANNPQEGKRQIEAFNNALYLLRPENQAWPSEEAAHHILQS